jgi:hypothetical protein
LERGLTRLLPPASDTTKESIVFFNGLVLYLHPAFFTAGNPPRNSF